MNSTNKKIFLVIDELKALGKIRFYAEVYRVMKMTKQHFNLIKLGVNYFMVDHIYFFIKEFNVNANYIFGTDTQMFIE
jgi:hypothetical protein